LHRYVSLASGKYTIILFLLRGYFLWKFSNTSLALSHHQKCYETKNKNNVF
jgi:hypothetical protein